MQHMYNIDLYCANLHLSLSVIATVAFPFPDAKLAPSGTSVMLNSSSLSTSLSSIIVKVTHFEVCPGEKASFNPEGGWKSEKEKDDILLLLVKHKCIVQLQCTLH